MPTATLSESPADTSDAWQRAVLAHDAAKAAYDAGDKIWNDLADQIDAIASGEADPLAELVQHYAVGEEAWNRIVGQINAMPPGRNNPLSEARRREARARLGFDDASRKQDALCDALTNRLDDAILTPAPDRQALLWKMERLFGPNARKANEAATPWCAKWVNAVMADARRLLAQ